MPDMILPPLRIPIHSRRARRIQRDILLALSDGDRLQLVVRPIARETGLYLRKNA